MRNIKGWKENKAVKSLWGKYSSVFLFVIVAFLLGIPTGDFFAAGDLKKVVFGNTALMIIVIGVAFIMIVGGIDLSVGYQISLVSVVIAMLSMRRLPDWLVIVGALAVGLLCGLLNGVLVAYLNIVPFAATIATQIIFHGISYYLSNGSMVSYISDTVRNVTKRSALGIRGDLWLVALSLFLFVLIIHFTIWGKYMRAIGLCESSAERAGVKVKEVKCFSYCLAGVLYAIASIILTSIRGYAGSEIGIGTEITAITAAYIGGVLWQAQQPNVINLIFGVLIVSVIESRLPKVGINSQVEYIITGIILVVAMGFYGRRRSKQE